MTRLNKPLSDTWVSARPSYTQGISAECWMSRLRVPISGTVSRANVDTRSLVAAYDSSASSVRRKRNSAVIHSDPCIVFILKLVHYLCN